MDLRRKIADLDCLFIATNSYGDERKFTLVGFGNLTKPVKIPSEPYGELLFNFRHAAPPTNVCEQELIVTHAARDQLDTE